jgi:nitrite reductase/ring-hydroxylating ferredoxin subunit
VSGNAAGVAARRRPTAVAHLGQLPEAGSFVTADAAGTALLVVRQDDGSVRALANVCRHRGARVETEPAGRRKMFACPYHRWCYTRTGAIRSITFDDGFAGVSPADLSLVLHPSAQAGNLVWVVPDRSTPAEVTVPPEVGTGTLFRGHAGGRRCLGRGRGTGRRGGHGDHARHLRALVGRVRGAGQRTPDRGPAGPDRDRLLAADRRFRAG